MSEKDLLDGEAIRRKVMGTEFVDAALDRASEFDMPLQEAAMEHAWGAVWGRDGLDLKTRSMITISMLIAQRAYEELTGHLRGALNNGVTPDEIREIIIHSASYCGYPAALSAMRVAKELIATEEA
jgi:4-carboxymuconolactone decarboxylase